MGYYRIVGELPHGYGPAAEEPPAERRQWCECGHELDDHNAEPDTSDGSALLETIKTALHGIHTQRPIGVIEAVLNEALVVCQRMECECRGFREEED